MILNQILESPWTKQVMTPPDGAKMSGQERNSEREKWYN